MDEAKKKIRKTNAERQREYTLRHHDEVNRMKREWYHRNKEVLALRKAEARKKKEQEIEEMRRVYILYQEGKLQPSED